MATPTDPIALIQALDLDALVARRDQIDAERKALTTLIRAAARRRHVLDARADPTPVPTPTKRRARA
jgi:hypothetical protein